MVCVGSLESCQSHIMVPTFVDQFTARSIATLQRCNKECCNTTLKNGKQTLAFLVKSGGTRVAKMVPSSGVKNAIIQ